MTVFGGESGVLAFFAFFLSICDIMGHQVMAWV